MSKFYFRQSEEDPNSYSVFVAGRLNSFGEPYCVLPLVTYDEAFYYCQGMNDKPAFTVDLIRLAFQTDQGAFHRAIDIARYLYDGGLWQADQLLYVEMAYTVHNRLFAFGGVDNFELRQMLVQYAPAYTTRRALYISPYAHDLRVNFVAEQIEDDIRTARREIQASAIYWLPIQFERFQ